MVQATYVGQTVSSQGNIKILHYDQVKYDNMIEGRTLQDGKENQMYEILASKIELEILASKIELIQTSQQ